jgi:hypothetical protein
MIRHDDERSLIQNLRLHFVVIRGRNATSSRPMTGGDDNAAHRKKLRHAFHLLVISQSRSNPVSGF